MNKYWTKHTHAVDAIETTIGSMQLAWTVDDDVMLYTGDASEREDGFVRIGTLVWESYHQMSYDDEMEHNLELLREFALDWKRRVTRAVNNLILERSL